MDEGIKTALRLVLLDVLRCLQYCLIESLYFLSQVRDHTCPVFLVNVYVALAYLYLLIRVSTSPTLCEKAYI